jgi:WD40 repeat protein
MLETSKLKSIIVLSFFYFKLSANNYFVKFNKKFVGHGQFINKIIYDSKNNFVISGSYDGSCKIWNYDTSCIVKNFGKNENGLVHIVTDLACKDDKLIIGSTNHEITSINLKNFKFDVLNNHKDFIVKLDFYEDKFLSSSYDSKIYLYENDIIKFEFIHPTKIDFFLVSQNKKLISISDNIIFIWDLDTGERIKTIYNKDHEIISSMTLSKNNLFLGYENGSLKILDLLNFNFIYQNKFKYLNVYDLSSINFLEKLNDDLIIIGCDFYIFVWDLKQNKEKIVLHEPHQQINYVFKTSSNKKFLLVGSVCAYLWDLNNEKLIWKSDKYDIPIKAVEFVDVNHFMISVNNEIHLYNLLSISKDL